MPFVIKRICLFRLDETLYFRTGGVRGCTTRRHTAGHIDPPPERRVNVCTLSTFAAKLVWERAAFIRQKWEVFTLGDRPIT